MKTTLSLISDKTAAMLTQPRYKTEAVPGRCRHYLVGAVANCDASHWWHNHWAEPWVTSNTFKIIMEL